MVQITAQMWPEVEVEENAEVDPPRNDQNEEPQEDEEQAQESSIGVMDRPKRETLSRCSFLLESTLRCMTVARAGV
jgi:hypothetical protein